ncbi:cytochrome P450 [Mycena galopus ATCC 62051]|nr:cytochrome P450 [Mycena galopus ATCC 62051]
MYTAGTGTTFLALVTFILSMLANPKTQKKAQAKIDSVVEQDRLPDFDDEASLPYVAALMKETIPHFLPVEDEYRGYRLPAGSILMPNTWAILHDEISIVRILATFDITKAVGEDGQIIEPTFEYFAGLVVQPLPFKCSIKPRSEKAVALQK